MKAEDRGDLPQGGGTVLRGGQQAVGGGAPEPDCPGSEVAFPTFFLCHLEQTAELFWACR